MEMQAFLSKIKTPHYVLRVLTHRYDYSSGAVVLTLVEIDSYVFGCDIKLETEALFLFFH